MIVAVALELPSVVPGQGGVKGTYLKGGELI